MSKRKASIELFRFINAILIVCCHMYMLDGNLPDWLFRGGYVSVEFFFILTGYLTFSHWEKISESIYRGNEAKLATQYMLRKIQKVLPYTTLAYFVIYAYYLIINSDQSVRRSILFEAIWDFSLMQTSGLSFYNYIQPLWYLSSLVFMIPVISYIYLKQRDLYVHILCWMLPCFVYGFFAKQESGLANSEALLRAAAGICVGGLCYFLTPALKKKIRNNIVVKVGIILTFAAQLYIAKVVRHSNEDLIIIVVIAVQIIFLMIDEYKVNKVFEIIMNELGKISLPIYIFHPVVMTFVRNSTKNLGGGYGQVFDLNSEQRYCVL